MEQRELFPRPGRGMCYWVPCGYKKYGRSTVPNGTMGRPYFYDLLHGTNKNIVLKCSEFRKY